MIEVKHVSLDYKSNKILEDVNLAVNKGEICGLVGRNGSGKTVLMKCICGFIPIKSGEIVVDDKVVGRDMDFPESMGIIIEYPVFAENKTGFQNLLLLASIKKIASKETIITYMKRFKLDPQSKTKVKKYSLGMKQKLAIIQAIMEDPEILILDEPFNSLDEESVELVREILMEEKEKGKIIIISSHNKDDIEILCDKVYEMKT
jgi:ABC-2 type transport system ATP-binding protein